MSKKDQEEWKKKKRLEAEKIRLEYLATLGLEKEVYITQSTLKNIFTDKVVDEYFPEPFSETQNPNLSKSYQRKFGMTMKLYRMADVMEAIKKGVEPRFKSGLKPEYKGMLSAFMLGLELQNKPGENKQVSKI